MILGALVLRPLPDEVAARVEAFARAMSVDDAMLGVARRFAKGQLGLAAVDFDRNGYTADWAPERSEALRTSAPGKRRRSTRPIGKIARPNKAEPPDPVPVALLPLA